MTAPGNDGELGMDREAAGIPASRLTEITMYRRSITAETALRPAKFFGTTPGFWVGPQAEHDLEAAERELGARIEKPLTFG